MATRKKPVENIQATETAAKEAPKPADNAVYAEREVKCDGYEKLNVRMKPNMRAKVIKTVPHGFKVMAAPSNGGWCPLEDGGYVMDEYLA